jgi:hypothetical protein
LQRLLETPTPTPKPTPALVRYRLAVIIIEMPDSAHFFFISPYSNIHIHLLCLLA